MGVGFGLGGLDKDEVEGRRAAAEQMAFGGGTPASGLDVQVLIVSLSNCLLYRPAPHTCVHRYQSRPIQLIFLNLNGISICLSFLFLKRSHAVHAAIHEDE